MGIFSNSYLTQGANIGILCIRYKTKAERRKNK